MENKIIVRKYEEKDLPAMIRIWNEVVEEGVAYPQEECLDEKNRRGIFRSADLYSGSREYGKWTGSWIIYSSSE